jgi:hypothetical protein
MKSRTQDILSYLLFGAWTLFLGAIALAQEPITVNPYSGLNSAYSRDLVKPTQAIRLQNYWFTTIGDLTKRPGFICFNSAPTSLDTFNVTALVGGYISDKELLLAVVGDADLADSLESGRLGMSILANDDYDSTTMQYLPPDNQYDYMILKDTVVIASGGAPTVTYTDSNGGNWWEITPPGAPLAVPIGDVGGGEVYGVFQYAWARETGNKTDDIGPPSIPIRLQGQRALVFIDRVGSGARGLYRRNTSLLDTTTASWFKVDTITSPGTTFSIDSLSVTTVLANDSNPGQIHDVYQLGRASFQDNDYQVGPGFPGVFNLANCAPCDGNGIDTGIYAWGVSWFNREGDSTPIVTVAALRQNSDTSTQHKQVNFASFPVVPPYIDADSMILWRSPKQDGGAGVWNPSDTEFYKIAQFSFNASGVSVPSSYEDTMHDITLVTRDKYGGGNMYGSLWSDSVPGNSTVDIYRIPAAIQVEEHHRQLWTLNYTDMNALEFSEINILDSFPVSNKLSFPSTDNDSVMAFKSMSDKLVVWMRRSMWLVSGVDQYDIRKIKTTEPIGCIAPKSVAIYGNVALFLTADGVYEYSAGGTPKPISDDIRDKFMALSMSVKERGEAVFTDEGRYILSFESATYVYDIKVQGWTEFTFGSSSWAYSNLTGSRKLWFGSRTGDSVMIFDTTVTGDQTDDTTHSAAILRLPYLGPYPDGWQIQDIGVARGGSGDSIRVVIYNGRNVAIDSVWMRPDSLYQRFAMNPSSEGSELSIEFDDRGLSDSLRIRTIHIWPRKVGGPPIW